MKDVRVCKYQMGFPALNKKLKEERKEVYDKLVIHIRLDELQGRGSRIVKIGKPTYDGTKITFRPVENRADYDDEMRKIIRDGEALGMRFEKVSV